MPCSRGLLASRASGGHDEWEATIEDFEAGQPRTSAVLDRRNPTELVHRGHCLWVVPVDKTPEEAREHGLDLMEAVIVEAIAWHPRVRKYIFECINCLRAEDLKRYANLTDGGDHTRTIFASIGGFDELVRTDTHSWVWQNRVEDFASVAYLDATAAVFPPLFPLQPYTRLDFAVTRRTMPYSRNVRWGATTTPNTFCHAGCVHNRRYNPQVHEMRWCAGACQRWYHVDCLGPSRQFINVFNPRVNGVRLSPNGSQWYAARHKAIIRQPRVEVLQYRGVPFSLEKIFLALRARGANYADTMDVGLPVLEHVVRELAGNEERERRFLPRLIQDILDALRGTPTDKLYKCVSAGCNEWI